MDGRFYFGTYWNGNACLFSIYYNCKFIGIGRAHKTNQLVLRVFIKLNSVYKQLSVKKAFFHRTYVR